MALKEVIEELKKLSPEDRAALAEVFGSPAAKPAPAQDAEELPEGREKNPPEAVKAATVYFFRQLNVMQVEEAKFEPAEQTIRKTATLLPPRVIAVDEQMAWRLYWKQRGKYQYLGRSDGRTWRRERAAGRKVGEAQAAEYEEMLKAPDMTPPMNREKTFFAGTKPVTAAQGREISWSAGMSQNRPE